MIKILHCATDDKFVDMALQSFKRQSNVVNHLAVFSVSEVKYVKSIVDFSLSKWAIFKASTTKLFNEYDLVVFHSLNPVWFRIINKLDMNSKIIWIGWGYDYYNYITGKKMLYLPATADLNNEIAINNIKTELLVLFKKIFYGSYLKKNILNKIKVFSPVLASEYFLMAKNMKEISTMTYSPWNYGNLEDNYIKDLNEFKVTGGNILVGNSATASNNHLDLIPILKKSKINHERKIILPLSYGCSNYANNIVHRFSLHPELNCHFLLNFMSLDQYIKTIDSCGFVIMNHVRQQAVSNIIMMLYFGAKVFLRESNPVYCFLKKIGTVIFSIEELESDVNLLNDNINDNQLELNRVAIRSYWSQKKNDSNTKEIIKAGLRED